MDMRVTPRPLPQSPPTDRGPAAPAPASDAARPAPTPSPSPVPTSSRAKGFVEAPTSTGLAFRVVDTENGTVVMQLPSEQSIKLRAYREALERARAEGKSSSDVTI